MAFLFISRNNVHARYYKKLTRKLPLKSKVHCMGLPRFTALRYLSQAKKVDFNKEFTMQRQVRLEAGIFTEQRDWSLHAEIDANPVEDPMRDKYQWATLTAGYATDSWWLPSARVGLSRNLAGTKLSYLNAGITVMKFINLDIATTLDTVNLEGDKIRRGINVRLGIQFEY